MYFPLVLTLTMVADSFAGERERHALETLLASRLSDRAILLGEAAALTSYGWLFGLVGAIMSIAVAKRTIDMLPSSRYRALLALVLLASA